MNISFFPCFRFQAVSGLLLMVFHGGTALGQTVVSLAEALDTPALVWTTGGTAPWTGVSGAADAQQDGDFTRSPAAPIPGSTWMETSLSDGGHVTCYCRFTGPAGNLRVLLDGQVVASVLPDLYSSFWQQLDIYAPVGGARVLRFECDNTNSGSWQVDGVSVNNEPVKSLAEALDAPQYTWTQSGNGGWGGLSVADVSDDGVDSALAGTRSGPLQTTCAGPCSLQFRWRTESSGASAGCQVNGQPVAFVQGNVPWQTFRTEVPGLGTNAFSWTGGTGVRRLDQVQIAPLAPLPLEEALDGGGLIWTTSPAAPWKGYALSSISHDHTDAAAGLASANDPSWIE